MERSDVCIAFAENHEWADWENHSWATFNTLLLGILSPIVLPFLFSRKLTVTARAAGLVCEAL